MWARFPTGAGPGKKILYAGLKTNMLSDGIRLKATQTQTTQQSVFCLKDDEQVLLNRLFIESESAVQSILWIDTNTVLFTVYILTYNFS